MSRISTKSLLFYLHRGLGHSFNKFHWIKDQVRDGTITITYILTAEMIAERFTKIYGKVKQAELVEKLGLTSQDSGRQVSWGVLEARS